MLSSRGRANGSLHIDMRQLPVAFVGDELGKFLKELTADRSNTRFVVHTDIERIDYFLKVIVRMDMVTPRFSYVFTDLVSAVTISAVVCVL
jgi:hypothetical protein